MTAPLLSICIPTRNRADLLALLLENITRECGAHMEHLEIVVSNNASSDATEAVVSNSELPIVYGRQTATVGFARNLLHTAATLANGEYVWVIGDDDMILPGGIARVLASIAAAPDVDYHYVNFGWIDVGLRNRLIRQEHPVFPGFVLSNYQCDLLEWQRLRTLEDLAFVPGKNPSALFSGVFCYVSRRQFFIDAQDWLDPTDSLDGSSTRMDDCFPHAMLTLPRVIGKPVAYIGEPCLLQGISAWEWKAYANKNMIFGTHQFFRWLESQGFAEEAMGCLWDSYHDMAGRLFSRMQCYPDENKGLDIVMRDAVPDAASQPIFWSAFLRETRLSIETDYEAEFLARLARKVVANHPEARLGLWGIQGRGYRFLSKTPDLHGHMAWVTDREEGFHGDSLAYTALQVSPPASITDANLDCLIIATRYEFIADVIHAVSGKLRPGTFLISVDGLSKVQPVEPAPPR